MTEDVLKGLVEVTLPKEDSFLLAKETLTRIGIASKKDKKLWPSCVILHKQGKYYLAHFLQMFAMDGKETTFSEEDRARLNTIAGLLQEWNIVTVVDPDQIKEPRATMSKIKIIPHKEKSEWTICHKYQVGGGKK